MSAFLSRRRSDPEEYARLHDALMRAERAYAEERELEHAVDLDLGGWQVPVAQPVLLELPGKVCCVVATSALRDPPTADREGAGSVSTALCFTRCRALRTGLPNDELHHAHPLYGRGFDGRKPQEVRRSSWVERARAFNSAHEGHRDSHFMGVRHFLVPFKDQLVEVQAEGISVQWFGTDIAETVAALVRSR